MTGKADLTKKHILKSVAPIFIKKGYYGTSLSDMTEATGLTKGALYGNFSGKEELAVEAFKFTIKYILKNLNNHLETFQSPLAKLFGVIDFYRGYLDFSKTYGGCPILNSGTNSYYHNERLSQEVNEAVHRMQAGLVDIIKKSMAQGELDNVDPEIIAGRMYAGINGGMFLSSIHDDDKYLQDSLDQLEAMLNIHKK